MFSDMMQSLKRRFFAPAEYVVYKGTVLPAAQLRWCGEKYKDNDFYLNSAETQARKLVDLFQCSRTTRILDVGCGQGRLANGLLQVLGETDYFGIDVHGPSIKWCKKYIEKKHPSFKFRHIHRSNERYNPDGEPISGDFRFDFADGQFDLIYLYSVFTHMQEKHMRIYLNEFKRLLAAEGHIFFTAFVETGVPPVSINPENYAFKNCSGPLHVVRYEKNYFVSMIEEAGFCMDSFDYHPDPEVNPYTAVVLSHKQKEA